MTEVWLLGEAYYVGGAIVGVFSTEEKAKQAMSKIKNNKDMWWSKMEIDEIDN